MKILCKFFLIFSIGFFAIASQTLLFREYLGSFAGNDIAVGFFFASWFFWIAVSSWINGKLKVLSAKFAEHFDLLSLLYIPAFVLQFVLILLVRKMADVEAYEIFPFTKMFFWSLIINMPVSFMTGFIFPSACLWIQKETRIPVAKVYIFEALGAFAGGLLVTILLIINLNSIFIFLILSFILSLASRLANKRKFMSNMPDAVLCLICFLSFTSQPVIEIIHHQKWSALIPGEAYKGSFVTSQAEYLFGNYNGQWNIIRENTVCESFPDREGGGRIAALHLCQNKDAKRILVVGSGLGISAAFLKIPQTEEVFWSYYDGEFVSKVLKILPENAGFNDKRFNAYTGDIRKLLGEKKGCFDIVILNLPDAVSSVLNRYFTTEFYSLIKDSLREKGILGLRISGGENVIGPELAYLGASAKFTLAKNFAKLAIVPGESTWLIASDSSDLSSNPETLSSAFALVNGADNIFPPEGLLSVYLPDRAVKALNVYNAVRLPDKFLFNRDRHPLAFIYGLLFTLKQAGIPAMNFAKKLLFAGMGIFFIPLPVFFILWFIYRLRSRGERRQSSFENSLLVFSSGFVSISSVIILMFMYQTHFGSLYLKIGLLSAVFMIGLAVGGSISDLFCRGDIRKTGLFLNVTILLHILSLLVILAADLASWTDSVFMLMFLLQGMFNGVYFPVAAVRLKNNGYETGISGAKLENADHLGAAIGAFSAGIIIFPFAGAAGSIFFLSALMFINIPVGILTSLKRGFSCTETKFDLAGKIAYILIGTTAIFAMCSDIVHYNSKYLIDASAKLCSVLPHGEIGTKIVNAKLPDLGFVYLLIAFTASLLVSFRGGRFSRYLLVFASLIIGGTFLNCQYSSEQVISLLSFNLPAPELAGLRLLIVGVPLFVLIFGNYYCGYICPFGALQEIVNCILPEKLKIKISAESMRIAFLIKYFLLFTIVVLFFLSWSRLVCQWDPLLEAFSPRRKNVVILTCLIALAGSMFHPRLWCRYLCPAGAFLSIINSIALLKKYLPVKTYGNCNIGISGSQQPDCIQCDLCRPEFHVKKQSEAFSLSKSGSYLFLVAIILVGIFLAGDSFIAYQKSFLKETPATSPALSQEKDVFKPVAAPPFIPVKKGFFDQKKIKELIKENRLSDKDADFSKELK